MHTAISMVFGKLDFVINRDDTITGLPFWEDLSLQQKEYIKNNSIIKAFNKGASIHGVGESCLGYMYVISGSIRAYVVSPDGREITLFRINEKDSCVLSASCVMSEITFDTNLVADKDTVVILIGIGNFQKLVMDNIYVKCFMYELATERFSQVMWVMQEILFKRFDQRLANFLYTTAEKNNNPIIEMTQEEIARETNSAREVVARMLRQFALDNIIENKRGYVLIKDMKALKALM